MKRAVIDPRSRANPVWWYWCWWTSVILILITFVIVGGELVGLISHVPTLWANLVAIALLIPVLIHNTRKMWDANTRLRISAEAMQAEHHPDVMGHCVACFDNWPCPWVDLGLDLEKLAKPSRTERLVRRLR